MHEQKSSARSCSQRPQEQRQGPHNRSQIRSDKTPHSGMHRGPEGHPRQFLQQAGNRILQVGEGTIAAGQSTEDFASRSRVSLCYQCCKRIPLKALVDTRKDSCRGQACRRIRDAGLEFIPMPKHAAPACEEFQTFLAWWMDKIDHGVDMAIEKRARRRVQETRDHIPDVVPAAGRK